MKGNLRIVPVVHDESVVAVGERRVGEHGLDGRAGRSAKASLLLGTLDAAVAVRGDKGVDSDGTDRHDGGKSSDGRHAGARAGGGSDSDNGGGRGGGGGEGSARDVAAGGNHAGEVARGVRGSDSAVHNATAKTRRVHYLWAKGVQSH